MNKLSISSDINNVVVEGKVTKEDSINQLIDLVQEPGIVKDILNLERNMTEYENTWIAQCHYDGYERKLPLNMTYGRDDLKLLGWAVLGYSRQEAIDKAIKRASEEADRMCWIREDSVDLGKMAAIFLVARATLKKGDRWCLCGDNDEEISMADLTISLSRA